MACLRCASATARLPLSAIQLTVMRPTRTVVMIAALVHSSALLQKPSVRYEPNFIATSTFASIGVRMGSGSSALLVPDAW